MEDGHGLLDATDGAAGRVHAVDRTPFQQAVLLATPLDDGGHIGFIINRPTARSCRRRQGGGQGEESVYLGGPAFLPAVFAITRKPPESAGAAVRLMPHP
jgi:putative AlgH/UPF0301 family transcriptional regulator